MVRPCLVFYGAAGMQGGCCGGRDEECAADGEAVTHSKERIRRNGDDRGCARRRHRRAEEKGLADVARHVINTPIEIS